MSLQKEIQLTASQIKRIESVEAKYKNFYLNPDIAEPLFLINVANQKPLPWNKMVASHEIMLQQELESIKPHLEIEDDYIPMARVQFGTAQIAAAFGADIHIFEDNLPAAKSHPLKDIQDVYQMPIPDFNSGWFPRLKEFTEFYHANLPNHIPFQLSDIQSPFNNAHLIRGDDIFTDFYDSPKEVEALLTIITDWMIQVIPYLKDSISADKDWFYDWGGLWKGTARISNCTMQMISPEFYTEYVRPQDERLMEAIGGGRIHYCGKPREVLRRFLTLAGISAVDYDPDYHNFYELCESCNTQTAIFQRITPHSEAANRLLKGEWPKKRNMLFVVPVNSIDEGKTFLKEIRQSFYKSVSA